MHAATITHYGPSSDISLVRIKSPLPGPGEVRLSVRASAINPYDWHQLTGTPWLVRNETGWRRPKSPRLGLDVAGIVECVGPGVTEHAVGDAVFGRAPGALAEEVIAVAQELVPKPASLSFEHAATLPIAGLTALQGLRDHGGVDTGARVLINGASGGVGTYAVQLARHLGAHVTGVCSGRNASLVRELGAHRTIDYTTDDFTREVGAYDVVLDNIGNRSPGRMKRCLRPNGTWVIVSGPKNRVFGPLGYFLRATLSFALNTRRARFFFAEQRVADLQLLAGLAARQSIRSVVERVFPLRNVVDAFAHLETGRTRGKIVVAPERPSPSTEAPR